MNEEVEVKDEAAKPADVVWLEPSPVGGEFMRHAQAMEPASRVPIYKAFAIAPGFNVYKKTFRRLMDLGVKIELRKVPSDPVIPVEKIFE